MAEPVLGANQGDLFGEVLSRISGAERSNVTGEAGGGAVRVILQGMGRVESVTIAEEALDDVDILQDLIAAAMNDALDKARASTQKAAFGLLEQLSQK